MTGSSRGAWRRPAAANLWLVGMMGAGKTDVGRRVAQRLGLAFVDTDAEVVATTGCSIAQLWRERGERAFRDLEEATVARLAAEAGRVVATGGGVVLREENVDRMRGSGLVVWLEAPAEVLAARVPADGTRPLLRVAGSGERTSDERRQRLDAILDRRRPAYLRAAHHVVATAGLDADAVADGIVELWIES